MKKILIVLVLLYSNIFAVDASLEIIKKSNNIPKIVVSVASDSNSKEYTNKIKKLLVQDLLVSGHFDVKEGVESLKFSEIPNMLGLRNKGIDLFINLSINESSFGGLDLNFKLYDNNSMRLILEKKLLLLNLIDILL